MSSVIEKNIWLVIPALNEEENLRWLLPKLVDKYEVIVVDNGSSDKTYDAAQELGAFSLSCQTKGYGIAVKSGIEFLQTMTSSDPVVVIFDADGTSPWEKIPDVVEPILKDNAEFVIGQRTQLMKGSMPVHADFGNWLQTTLIGLFTGFYFKDMGPMRAVRLSSFLRLQMVDKTWGWNVEMQIKALSLKFRVKEIGLTYSPRRFGESKISGSLMGSIRAGTKIIYAVFYYYLKSLAMKKPALSEKSGFVDLNN